MNITSESEQALWPAPAKLNLMLRIIGQRDDGYHLLQTVFQFLDFGDTLKFRIREDGQIRRLSPLASVAHDSDLTVRAARKLQQETGSTLGADILLDKHIPMGGGLGGGSSDAATTLVALNREWQLGLAEDDLAHIGLSLGADVPVFVRGQAAWGEGVGEVLEPIEPPVPWYLLVIPPCLVSTAELFSAKELTRNATPIKIAAFFAGEQKNVFEPLVRARYKEVDQAMDWLSRFGQARLTGTGSTVFAAFEQEQEAKRAVEQMPEGWRGVVCKGLNRSPLMALL